MYLKHHRYSDGSIGVYSVKGWYEYDKYKIKIPIVGHFNGDLHLYVIEDSLLCDTILNFKFEAAGFWEEMKKYTQIDRFKEKFTIVGDSGIWESRENKYDIFFNIDELDICSTTEYLVINSRYFINLSEYFKFSTPTFSINNYVSNKVLLNYSLPSRGYAMGRCGAGIEEGLILLNFDDKMALESYDIYEIGSCNNEVEYKVIKRNNQITEYYITDYRDNSVEILVFNKSEFRLKWKKN